MAQGMRGVLLWVTPVRKVQGPGCPDIASQETSDQGIPSWMQLGQLCGVWMAVDGSFLLASAVLVQAASMTPGLSCFFWVGQLLLCA